MSTPARARVLVAIKHLDFVPSPTARRLSRTQTGTVILPFLTRPSLVERRCRRLLAGSVKG